jgi:hypothetical protein
MHPHVVLFVINSIGKPREPQSHGGDIFVSVINLSIIVLIAITGVILP